MPSFAQAYFLLCPEINSLLSSVPDFKRIYTIENGARELSLINQYGAILVNDEATLNEPKEIRFITPEYCEKFKLPDGGHVLIGRRNGSVTEHKCQFLDPYHFLLDHTTYHICQFAEMLQASGSYVVPFPEKRVIWSNIDMDMETWNCHPTLPITIPEGGCEKGKTSIRSRKQNKGSEQDHSKPL